MGISVTLLFSVVTLAFLMEVFLYEEYDENGDIFVDHLCFSQKFEGRIRLIHWNIILGFFKNWRTNSDTDLK